MRLIALALLTLGCLIVSAQTTQTNKDGDPLLLTLVQSPSGKLFGVELNNTGDKALILNLGMMLANGREQYANRIHLLLQQPDGGLLHLEMTGPGAIAGRLDPLIVPLPKGATFTLPIDLKNYSAPRERVWNLKLTAGKYSLRAEFNGVAVSQGTINSDVLGISLMPYWVGTVRSNVLPFTVN